MNQNQIAQLFATSKQSIGQHIANILKEEELSENSVVSVPPGRARDPAYKILVYVFNFVPWVTLAIIG